MPSDQDPQSKLDGSKKRLADTYRKRFPNWRAGIKLDGIPVDWDSNLDDDDIRQLYLLLKNDFESSEDIPEPDGPHASGGLTIRLPSVIQRWVEFKDGACWIIGLKSKQHIWLLVEYRTSLDWELWKAHQQELQELCEEKEQERKADKELYKAQDDHLSEQIVECLSHKQYERILDLFRLRLDLVEQYKHLRIGSYKVKQDAMQIFCRLPTTNAGIEFLKSYSDFSYQYERFADRYLFWNAGKLVMKEGVLSYEKFHERPSLIPEVEKIFQAAIQRFPTDNVLFARICRFWRRNSQLPLAIQYCQLAMEKGLNDGSKTGFVGLLKRLRKQAGITTS